MENQDNNLKDNRIWYKKKRYIIPLAIFALLVIFGSGDNSQPSITTNPVCNSVQQQTANVNSANTATQPIPKPIQQNNLSNNNYYTNVNGNTVHSPVYSNSVPAGASARCRDGTYSFSQNRRGTCSHHGGVAEWL